MYYYNKTTPKCVSLETKLLTDKGWQVISDHTNQNINIWNGVSFTQTYIRKTGSNRKTYKLTTDNSDELWSTLNHKFYIYKKGKIDKVMLHEAEPGQELLQLELPKAIDGKYPLYNLEKKVNSFLEDLSFIPDNFHLLRSRVDWLNKFLAITDFKLLDFSYIQILYTSDKIEVLRELRWFLMTIGCRSKVIAERDLFNYFDLDQSDADLVSSDTYHLLISKNDLVKLYRLRVTFNSGPASIEDYLNDTHKVPRNVAYKLYSVVIADIDLKNPKIVDTYCFNEPVNHIGFFNGILTGQSENLK